MELFDRRAGAFPARFSGGEGVAGVIGVDLFDGFGDLAEELRQDLRDYVD